MRRTRICLEGWCYLVLVAFIFGGAIVREINLLLFVAGIMLGPFILSWRLLVRSLAKVTVSRSLPDGVGAGELFPVKLTVSNAQKRLGVWGLTIESEIRKLNDQNSPTALSAAFLPFVGQKSKAHQSYDCRILDRGVYEFGPMRVASRFPLGLFKRALLLGEARTLFVYPRLGRLRRKWQETVHPSNLGNQRSQHRPGFTEGEFHSLRDWRNSDSRRWIHWRTSARRNQLTVRQFERRQNRNLAILLEMRPEQGTQESLERAIQFVATAVASHCRTGSSHLLLGVAGKTIKIVSGVSSAGLMRDCMESLATATASDSDPLPLLIDQALDQVDAQARIVVVSPHPINLTDTSRFSKAWDKPNRRHLISRISCIEANAENLAAYFEASADIRQQEQLDQQEGPVGSDGLAQARSEVGSDDD